MTRKKQSGSRKKTGKVIDRGEMVELRDTSPYWQIVFSLYGTRVSKSSRSRNKREAEKMAKALWHEMDDQHVRIHGKRGVPTAQRDDNLISAVDWYLTNVGSKTTNAKDIEKRLTNILDALGPNLMLSEIDDLCIIDLIAKLEQLDARGKPENGKMSDHRVNRHVTTLRHLMNVSIGIRKFQLPDAPHWPRHTLANVPRTREADIPEIDAMTARWRIDMRAALLFLFESGLRLQNAVELQWSQVDWIKGVISVKVKAPNRPQKRMPRDPKAKRKPREIPITPVIAEILAGQLGKHDTAVFTFTATKTCRVPYTDRLTVRGQNYPLLKRNFQTHWQKVKHGCEIKDLTIHDLRRTRGSWLYRATGDIKLVKEFLHHADIATTDSVYAHVSPEQVAKGMIRAGEYEQTLRARHAVLADAHPAIRAHFAGMAPGNANHESVSPSQGSRIAATSTSSTSSITSIEEARAALRRIELNPVMQKAILDLGETSEPSVVGGVSPGRAGNSMLQEANCRKMTEVALPVESNLAGPRSEQLTTRFARSCEPYMDDPGFVFSMIEAFDRCFGTDAAPSSTN